MVVSEMKLRYIGVCPVVQEHEQMSVGCHTLRYTLTVPPSYASVLWRLGTNEMSVSGIIATPLIDR